MRRSWLKKIVLVPAALLTLLGVIELGMRLVRVQLEAPQERLNAIESADAHRLRILAVGESTTAESFARGPEGAWPRQLERSLREHGVDARVYNEGRPLVSSGIVRSRLPEYVERYRPHVVITMVGINDELNFIRVDTAETSGPLRLLGSLKIVQLGGWIASRLRTRSLCRIDDSPFDGTPYTALIQRAVDLARTGSVTDVEALFTAAGVHDPHIRARLLSRTAVGIREDWSARPELAHRAAPYTARAFALFPLSHAVALIHLVNSHVDRNGGSARGVEASWRLLECGENLPDDPLGLIAHFARLDPAIAEAPVFRRRHLDLTVRERPTAVNYRAMHHLLREKGIVHVAMQYPTLPLATLRSYFERRDGTMEPEADDVHFVSNEENFAAAMATRPYDDLFWDRFRGSWGHTTSLGHALIAQRALEGVRAAGLCCAR